MARKPVPNDFKKNHRIAAYFRKDEKDFVEDYLTQQGITLRQLALKVLNYKPSASDYL